MDLERNNQQLEQRLNERTNELNRTKIDLDHSNVKNEKLMEDNGRLFNEIERLKSHVLIITEQNQNVSITLLSLISKHKSLPILSIFLIKSSYKYPQRRIRALLLLIITR